jgi:hypothetical protein
VLVSPGANGEVVDAGDPEALAATLAAWLGRQPPVTPAQLEGLRPSRMETTFAQALEGYVAALDAAQEHRWAGKRPSALSPGRTR